MKIEKIQDTKLKISLEIFELEKYSISHKLFLSNVKTIENFIYHILENINTELFFYSNSLHYNIFFKNNSQFEIIVFDLIIIKPIFKGDYLF